MSYASSASLDSGGTFNARSIASSKSIGMRSGPCCFLSGLMRRRAHGERATLFSRRVEGTAWAAGATAAGTLGSISWVAFARREETTGSRFSPREFEPLEDEWDADGWTAGGAAQVPVLSPRLLLTADLRYTTLEGEGRRADVEEVILRAEESRAAGHAELRLLPGGAWEAAARVGLARESRTRRDLLAEVASEIDAWSPSAAAEVARWLSGRLAVSLAGAVSQHAPTSAIPDTTATGPIYDRWTHPALALEATEAWAWVGALTLRAAVRAGMAVWLRGQLGSASARNPEPDVPSGDREGWSVTLGVVLGER